MSNNYQSNINLQIPSPLQKLDLPNWNKQLIKVWIKRDDLIHPEISGNKWRKLKLNIEEMRRQNKVGILSFGGAYSNHVHALAAAGKHLGFETVGFIRGDGFDQENPTLQFAKKAGMKLQFLDRTSYRQKEGTAFIFKLQKDYPDFLIVPEGGANELGIAGCQEIVHELKEQIPAFDQVFVAAGTGTTASGILAALPKQVKLHVISVLKGDFLKKEILKNQEDQEDQLVFHSNYHFGGYAKFDESLIQFIRDFRKKHEIQLDPIYTAKLFYAVQDLLKTNQIEKDSKVVIIHSGGLQGILGFQERHGLKLS